MARKEEKEAVEEAVEESQAKKNLREVYALYQKENPERYALKNKEAELEAKLAKLK